MAKLTFFLLFLLSLVFGYEYCQGIMETKSRENIVYDVKLVNKEDNFFVVEASKPLPRKKNKLLYKIPLDIIKPEFRTKIKANSDIYFTSNIECNDDKKCERLFFAVHLNLKGKRITQTFDEPFVAEIYFQQ